MGSSRFSDYLRSRRNALKPSDVGLDLDGKRRVPGLRREEVARLAGISEDYYLRLEQGRDSRPSDQVLNALARALRLTGDEPAYFFALAHPAPAFSPPPVSGDTGLEEGVQRLLDSWSHTPALVIDGCMDVLASNPLAVALSPGQFSPGDNLVLSIFTPLVRQSAPDWQALAAGAVAALRINSDPDDPRLHEIVGMLSADDDFSRLWARHDVRTYTSGTATFYVEPFGLFPLRYHDFIVPGQRGLMLTVFFADADSVGESALAELARRVALGIEQVPVTELPAGLPLDRALAEADADEV